MISPQSIQTKSIDFLDKMLRDHARQKVHPLPEGN